VAGNGFPSTFRIQPSGGGGGGGAGASNQIVVSNDTGSTLTKGTCVQETYDSLWPPSVAAINGTTNYAGAPLLGVLAEDIADGATGLCQTAGELDGIDTSGFSVGDFLTADATGQLSNSGTIFQVGYVVTAAVAGSIFVLPERQTVPIHVHASNTSGGALAIGFNVVLDGYGSALSTGHTVDLVLPSQFVLQQVVLLADQTGDIEVDILQANYGGFPSGSSICGGSPPAISSGDKFGDNVLSGWTVNFSQYDILRFHVDSCTSITRCTVFVSGIY
jgi:hypothetical protein